MELPEIIARLPEVDLPIPTTTVRTSLLQSDDGQLVFFQILKDVELPAHSHKGQWGTVLEGQVELTVSGETRRYQPGGSYYIPAGAIHSAKLVAGTKIIEFFEEPDRYKRK
ncbi:MAG: cupin domain-containing protein [Betaproteobacteria bacterium]|nr:cupin domain-containing protein [Betaproteobacteria bacterium]